MGDEIWQAIRNTSEPDPTTSNLLQSVEQGVDDDQRFFRAMVQATPMDKNTGLDMNDNKPVDLPDQVPAGRHPAGQISTGHPPS